MKKKKPEPAEDHLRSLTDDELMDLGYLHGTPGMNLDRHSVVELLRRMGIDVTDFRAARIYTLNRESCPWMDEITDEELSR